jgi:methionyl-tRNA formyltransferase
VQRAIIAGDEVTGASVFQLVPELDAGDVFGTLTQSIGALETAGHLLESLSASGAELLVRVVDAIADGTARAEPQRGDVTLAPKLHLADAHLDFAEHATTVAALIRGVTPEPGAFTILDDARLKILDAVIAREEPRIEAGRLELRGGRVLVGTGSDPLEIVTVHPAGKKPMNATDWWRGRTADAGTVAR